MSGTSEKIVSYTLTPLSTAYKVQNKNQLFLERGEKKRKKYRTKVNCEPVSDNFSPVELVERGEKSGG